ncbi:Respiratory supercomplex factor 1 [Fusarium oxysporum f. sp. albedinis]|nr:Respiratory supercomplex factor 1 [Fusarium oxysporum f. sp. albedinis]
MNTNTVPDWRRFARTFLGVLHVVSHLQHIWLNYLQGCSSEPQPKPQNHGNHLCRSQSVHDDGFLCVESLSTPTQFNDSTNYQWITFRGSISVLNQFRWQPPIQLFTMRDTI